MTLSSLLERIYEDVKYTLRAQRKQPVLALAAIATLALGIGANTGIFTVINAVLLKPLTFHDPDSLVRVPVGATFARFEAIQSAKSFAAVGASNSFTADVTLSRDGESSEGLKAVRVSTNFFSVLGVQPSAGRGFLPAEESNGSCVTLISESLWNRSFARSTSAVGGAARVAGVPCTIIGVLPRTFAFPFPDVDLWMPLQPAAIPLQARMHSPTLSIIARVKEGVPLQQANEEMKLVHAQYRAAHPAALDAKSDRPEDLVLLKDQLVRNVRPTLWMLMGAVGFLLAIACANIAGLFLARAKTRSREMAVRLALGASYGRLTTLLLTESVILALLGGALGMGAAAWIAGRAVSIPGLELPRATEIHLDGTVLLFATLLSVATGLLFGLAPSRVGLRADLMDTLRGGDEIPASHWRNKWSPFITTSRSVLVTFQMVLSTVLLIGAVLLIQSVVRLQRVDLGFDAQNLLTMRLAMPRTTPGTGPNFDAIVERVRSIPGVTSAAVTLTLPAAGFAGTPVWPTNGAPPPLNKRPIAVLQTVSSAYFQTLGIALRRGRVFDLHDSASAPKVVIINETLARRFWPAYPQQDPIGQSILAGASVDPLQIVGVVADVRQAGPGEQVDPGIYRPRSQVLPMSAMLVVRTKANPLGIVNAVRSEVTAVDRNMSVVAVKTMADVLGESDSQRRGFTTLLVLFAATGLLLASVGVYGVVAYSVTMRTREFGIRKALGAQRADILQLVLRQGLKLTLIGSMLGLCIALALTRLLQRFLFEVKATDPATFAGVALLCIAVSILASYLPARRATRVEPSMAVRTNT